MIKVCMRDITTKILVAAILIVCIPTFLYGGKKNRQSPARISLAHPALVASTTVSVIPPPPPSKFLNLHDTISITFIGDVMQHGKQLQDALIPDADPSLPQSYDYSYTFKYIEEQLKRADLAVANMEFPLGTPPYSGYPLFSAPESILWQAQKCGIDLFLLANNHLLDKGKRGFLNTIGCYEKAGARYIGIYRNKEEEKLLNPVFYNIKGIRVALLNFSYGTNGFAVPEPCTMNMMDTLHIKECITRAKSMGADIIICTPHWGEEYSLKPSGRQKEIARMLLREGVRIIVGSHPHVPQSAEYSKESILFYSLGNYISNQTTPDYTQLELMVTVKIVKNWHTGKVELQDPDIEFLWCFKKNEFAPHYTVVPVKEILGGKMTVKDRYQYNRMVGTYESFNGKNLIKKK